MKKSLLYIVLGTLSYSHYVLCMTSTEKDAPVVINFFNETNMSTQERDLAQATRANDIAAARALLEQGVSSSIALEGDTLFHVARQNNSEEVVQLLLEYGAPVNAYSWAGELPLDTKPINRNSRPSNMSHRELVAFATGYALVIKESYDRIIRLLLQYNAQSRSPIATTNFNESFCLW